MQFLSSSFFLSFTLAGCLGRPGVQEETNSDSNYDYTYDDNTDDSEDEVSELDVPARFVSKEHQREVERGQTAKLECAVERWIYSNFFQFLFTTRLEPTQMKSNQN